MTQARREQLTKLEFQQVIDDTVDTTEWPDSLLLISRTIGPAAALKLCDHVGGTRGWYIARKASPKHDWAKLIGMPAYTALCKEFGGQKIDIPRFHFRGLKKRQIIEMAETTKLSKRQIALACRCTEGYVQNVLNSLQDDTQLKLF